MIAMISLAGSIGMVRAADTQWTLSTDDTCLKVSVSNNKIYIDTLKNPAQDWNWVPVPSEVPLPGKNSIKTGDTVYTPNWTYCEVAEDKSDGYTVTLRFTSTTPNLELKSIWRAQSGPGAVENWMTIENKSGGDVTYSPDIAASRVQIRADKAANLHRFKKTNVGYGKVYNDVIGANADFGTNLRIIPYIMLDVGSAHGMYIGYEWELGGFKVTSDKNPLEIIASAYPISENVTQGNNEIFTIPNVYYGTYKGNIDDGSNRFKKWFWNHKITRSLYNNTNEPWTEACVGDGGPGPTDLTPFIVRTIIKINHSLEQRRI